jgi:hypothetical protein
MLSCQIRDLGSESPQRLGMVIASDDGFCGHLAVSYGIEKAIEYSLL